MEQMRSTGQLDHDSKKALSQKIKQLIELADYAALVYAVTNEDLTTVYSEEYEIQVSEQTTMRVEVKTRIEEARA